MLAVVQANAKDDGSVLERAENLIGDVCYASVLQFSEDVPLHFFNIEAIFCLR